MAETAAPRRRRQGSRRDPSIDADVLAAARRLLIERGYANTTIDLIAATANVSRPAVYRRWRSKAHLVHEALFPDLGQDPPEDDFVAEITRLCRGALAMYADPAVAESIPGLLNDLRADRGMRRMLSDRLEATARSQLGDRLTAAVDAGVARPDISADTVMDVIAGGAWYAVCVRRVKDVDAAAAELCALVLNGVLISSSA
ncbi:DNA-binding transcriptional regulator, AcrR family [Mycolicibacterium rutilum]|uniref:DNA-binding transcriptional regulator, AcrR family n=1 Tax=Mycolicibacterium rutilum TaxID=370526 RepID=A0A1H6J247_MYCRU|nr:TetR/AcrR family transcriptional regulator [Mycolicibacterium rutilum]SEH55955.1 DNA-binding transcriptional regulator, AcrR family [Mycolicibacterium rutilum]